MKSFIEEAVVVCPPLAFIHEPLRSKKNEKTYWLERATLRSIGFDCTWFIEQTSQDIDIAIASEIPPNFDAH
jgi:hypothetical protein